MSLHSPAGSRTGTLRVTIGTRSVPQRDPFAGTESPLGRAPWHYVGAVNALSEEMFSPNRYRWRVVFEGNNTTKRDASPVFRTPQRHGRVGVVEGDPQQYIA